MCPWTRTLLGASVLVLVSFAAPAPAQAIAPPRERIELRLYTPKAEILEPGPDLVPARRIAELPDESSLGGHDGNPLVFRMPDVGPESLALSVELSRFTLSVAADLAGGRLPFTPRADCNANDTYFWMRGCFTITDRASVFVESFQGANSFVPSGIPTPRWTWDGFQVELGLRVRLDDRWFFEGGPVSYMMSATRRPDQLGTRLGFECSF